MRELSQRACEKALRNLKKNKESLVGVELIVTPRRLQKDNASLFTVSMAAALSAQYARFTATDELETTHVGRGV